MPTNVLENYRNDQKIEELRDILASIFVSVQETSNKLDRNDRDNYLGQKNLHLELTNIYEAIVDAQKGTDTRSVTNENGETVFNTDMAQNIAYISSDTLGIRNAVDIMSNNSTASLAHGLDSSQEQNDIFSEMTGCLDNLIEVEEDRKEGGIVNSLIGGAKNGILGAFSRFTKGFTVSLNKSSIGELVDGFKPVITKTGAETKNAITSMSMKEKLKDVVAAKVAQKSESLMDAIIPIITKIGNAIAKFVENWGNPVKVGLALSIPLITGLGTLMLGLYMIFNELKDFVGERIDKIVDVLKVFSPANLVSSLFDGIKDLMDASVKALSDTIGDAWKEIKTTVSEAVDALINGVKSFFEIPVVKSGVNLVSKMGGAVMNRVTNFINGDSSNVTETNNENNRFEAMTSPITSSIHNFAEMVEGYLKQLVSVNASKPVIARSKNSIRMNTLGDKVTNNTSYANASDGSSSQDFNSSTNITYGGSIGSSRIENQLNDVTDKLSRITEVISNILEKMPAGSAHFSFGGASLI